MTNTGLWSSRDRGGSPPVPLRCRHWRPAGSPWQSAAPSKPIRSPIASSSCGVWRDWLPRAPQTWIPSSRDDGVRSCSNVPTTLVAISEECTHSHHRTERLKPEGMRQPGQHLVAAILQNDCLSNHRAQPGHPITQPSWRTSAVKRQVGAAGAPRHQPARVTAAPDGWYAARSPRRG
jgi:hypothetical protein